MKTKTMTEYVPFKCPKALADQLTLLAKGKEVTKGALIRELLSASMAHREPNVTV